MADDDKKTDDTSQEPEPDATSDADAGKKGLDAERRARRAAEKQLKELQDKLKQLEDRDKSEAEKLRDAVTVAEKRAEDAEQKLLRLEVGLAKGLTAAQARRLVGTTREELEADADDLLATFGATAAGQGPTGGDEDKPKQPPARGRPTEKLRPGASTTDVADKVDAAKLAASILERPF